MKLYEMLKYDSIHGLKVKPLKWVIIATLSAFLYFYFYFDVLHMFWSGSTLRENIENIANIGISFGDVILYVAGGISPFVFTSLVDNFQFPVRWLLPNIVFLYVTLNYATNDMTHGGIQMLTRIRNRKTWWFSKCLWNVLTVISCYMVEMGTLYVLSAATGIKMSFSLNPYFFNGLYEYSLPTETTKALRMVIAFCVMPVIVSISVSLLQMALTLFIKPIYAYVIACVYYILGVYCANPLFISNYAMGIRSEVIGICEFKMVTGICICVSLSIASIFVGAQRASSMDLINLQ